MARILCFGDSNTAGFHSAGRGYEPYASTLTSQLAHFGWNCKVQQEGLSGLTAQTMVAQGYNSQIMDVVGIPHKGLSLHLHEQPDVVIIMAGTNDLGAGQSPEEVLRNVVQLHEQCHELGIATVAMAPPTVIAGAPRQKRERFARMLQQWAGEQSDHVLHFADAEQILPRGLPEYWESDQLHFSPSGSRELGRQLARMLLPALDRLDLCAVEESHGMATPQASCMAQASWLQDMFSAFNL